MSIRFAAFAAVLSFAAPAAAQDRGSAVLFDLLMLPDIIEIMREEGVAYGDTIGADLFGGETPDEWTSTVAEIYGYDRMLSTVQADFDAALADVDLSPMIDFFSTEQGQMIVGLEVSARRALLDEAVEQASKDAVSSARADEDPRLELVGEFVDANNLIETNVEGALNSNLAFYTGLLDGNAFGGALSEDQVLTDVWSQEATIRDNTTEWIYSFLFMAYQPLDDADLDAYIAFSQTEAGTDLNRAMFEGFDRLFVGISRSLGRAAANEIVTQDL